MKILGMALAVVLFLVGISAISLAWAALVFPAFQQAADLLRN